jgi:poly(A) polymerase
MAESDVPANDPLRPSQEPISLDGPTQVELDANEKLIEFLRSQDCFESQERADQRASVLQDLQEIVQKFIQKICESPAIQKPADGTLVKAQLYAFGSYRLGVCSPSSDIDILCLTPRFVNRKHFFRVMHDLLLASPKVKKLTKIEAAYVPIMTMEFSDVDIDLSFASLDLESVPDDLDLSNDALVNSLDLHAVNSVNGVRTNDMILELIPSVEQFRLLLRFVRIWSKARAIYGNVYGYLGGINCSLLCAWICQRYPNACAATLILMLFMDLAEWPWPKPIYINTPNTGFQESWNPKTSQDVMPIITPAYPAINSLRSATKSTRQRIVEEFKRGAQLMNKIILKGAKWSTLVVPSNFFVKYQTFVQVKVWADTEKNFEIWLGTVESRIKKLSLNLEGNEQIEAAITYPEAFRTCPDSEGHQFGGSFFTAVCFEKSKNGEKQPVDISRETKWFLTDLMTIAERQAPWLAKPLIVTRKNLPLFVFPGGVRPEPKKPKAKKAAHAPAAS